MPKISALPLANAPALADLLVLDQSLTTKRLDFNTLQSAVANAGTVQSLIQQAVLAPLSVPVPIAKGGTGQITQPLALTALNGVDATALSGASGSTLVGFIQSGAGAVARSGQSKWRDAISVKDFGAVGDGSTDDSVAIQAAITFVVSFTQGARVYFPVGTYKVTAGLTVPNGKKITLCGDGMRHSVMDWQGANGSVVFKVAGTASTADVTFEKFEIKSSIGATGVVGIRTGETTGNNLFLMLKFSEILFNGIATGIDAYDESDEVVVSRCWFFGLTSGVLLNSPGATSTSNWAFEYNHFQGLTGRAVDVANGSAFNFIGNVVQGSSTTQKGFRLDKFDSANFRGNYWECSAAAATGPFIELGPTAIGTGNMSGFHISGNHIDSGTSTAGQVGIKLDNCRGGYVGENSFTAINTAIQLTANAQNITIGQQVWGSNVTNAITNAGITGIIVLDQTFHPSFLTFPTAQLANKTGAGTTYTVIFGNNIFNNSGSYDASTGIYTALYSGSHEFECSLYITGLTAAMTLYSAAFVTTNRTYVFGKGNIGAMKDVNSEFMVNGKCRADMSIGHTCKVTLNISNGAGDTADIEATSFFSGNYANGHVT